jgi:hypothetical protein
MVSMFCKGKPPSNQPSSPFDSSTEQQPQQPQATIKQTAPNKIMIEEKDQICEITTD